jgi:hypothetical protein
MKKQLLCTLALSILSVPILVEGRGGAAAPAGHASAATGTSGMSGTSTASATSTTLGGVPLGAFPSGAPREYHTTNAEGQVVVGTLPVPAPAISPPPPSGPPVAAGQPALPYGAANQASSQMQFEAELARVSQMEGHPTQNQFSSVTNADGNVRQP